VLEDCRSFMKSKDWYAHRGIPFRRGYLLVRPRALTIVTYAIVAY
jgi:hypothetical protein